MTDLPRIKLRYDRSLNPRPHVVAVVAETDEHWEGYLVEASDGTPVTRQVIAIWPKFAWKQVW